MKRLVNWLAHLWAVDDSNRLPSSGIDLIALVSIGATPTRLTNGAVASCNKALRLLWKYPGAAVVFGAFTGNGDHLVEETEKSHIFPSGRCVGKVLSTIGECLAYKQAFPNARSVVFITEEAHSRRAQIVWKTLWPEATIYIVPVKLSETIDPDSPMKPYWAPWSALFWQAIPTPYFLYLALRGKKYMESKAHFHQPIARR